MKKVLILFLLSLNGCMMKDYVTYEYAMRAETGGEQVSLVKGTDEVTIVFNKMKRGNQFSLHFEKPLDDKIKKQLITIQNQGSGLNFDYTYFESNGIPDKFTISAQTIINNIDNGLYVTNKQGERISNILKFSIVEPSIIAEEISQTSLPAFTSLTLPKIPQMGYVANTHGKIMPKDEAFKFAPLGVTEIYLGSLDSSVANGTLINANGARISSFANDTDRTLGKVKMYLYYEGEMNGETGRIRISPWIEIEVVPTISDLR